MQVCRSWWGRMRLKQTPTMEMFFAQVVQPCLDIEPGAGLKEAYLNKLLCFLASEEGTGPRDLDLVRDIVTGKVQRRPALHGAAVSQAGGVLALAVLVKLFSFFHFSVLAETI